MGKYLFYEQNVMWPRKPLQPVLRPTYCIAMHATSRVNICGFSPPCCTAPTWMNLARACLRINRAKLVSRVNSYIFFLLGIL